MRFTSVFPFPLLSRTESLSSIVRSSHARLRTGNRRRNSLLLAAGVAALLAWLPTSASAAPVTDGSPDAEAVADDAAAAGGGATIDFSRQIQPLLARRCFACHGPDDAQGSLAFIDRDAALAETDSGMPAIVPGDAEASELLARVTSEYEGERMPPEGEPLTPEEIELLRNWIDEGAAWGRHWSFEPMKSPQPPQVDNPQWAANPIDAFIYAGLDKAGLAPNPPADKRTLIRRAYYDLWGLPPEPADVERFVADDDPQAYEKLVERLLESPHYGEKWGRHWLDLVRYGETNSFERDGAKPNAWKYRDYVIRSFNDDKPYGQFVREQLAGDELDEVTTDTLTATGYYRLGIWDDEPADPLQARYDELDDIVATTGQVFLGLTIDCARCHDHKIDPIPQTDYYSILAFLADVTSYGVRSDQVSNNQIDVTPPEVAQRYAELDQQRQTLEEQLTAIEQQGIVKMSAPDQRATEGSKADRNRVLDAKLEQHLEPQQWQRYGELKQELAGVNREYRRLPERQRVLGLGRVEAQPPETFVMFRGNPHSPTDVVGLEFPQLFGEPAPEMPQPDPQARSAGRRRILADWITQPDNRMTWRVMANRIWQFHFGRGIVESSNNFGQLGTQPTHPELLDYLGQRLLQEGESLKAMHRLIMNSRVYQMSSAVRDDAYAQDPQNQLLWKFDSRRLSAEEVRDTVLAVNGSLNRQVYGPSVYPPLSAEVLAGQSQPGQGWNTSGEQEANRRSVYIHVKRSLLTPLLSAFDLPEPDRTCEARFTTLQPGQALSLLNGDFIHLQAGRLADKVEADTAEDNAEIVRRTVYRVLARPATAAEIAAGDQLINDLQSEFKLPRRQAIELYCLTVLNWNEFVFLD